jgi:hypothetical protein
MMKNRNNGITATNRITLRWDKFPDFKEIFMKYYSNMVIGDFDELTFFMWVMI